MVSTNCKYDCLVLCVFYNDGFVLSPDNKGKCSCKENKNMEDVEADCCCRAFIAVDLRHSLMWAAQFSYWDFSWKCIHTHSLLVVNHYLWWYCRKTGTSLLLCAKWNVHNYFADSSIDAAPSFKPAKKYSDLSGLPVCSHQFTSDFCHFLMIRTRISTSFSIV